MKITFFDANCAIGGGLSAVNSGIRDSEGLLRVMDKKGIDRALVFHSLAKENLMKKGNAKIAEEAARNPRLLPCWVAMPHYSGECESPADMLKGMKKLGIKAVRIFPVYHKVNLHIWLWEELFSVLSRHRIPVFVDFSNTGWSQEIDWDGIHKICLAFPELPLILLRQGQVADRYLYFLLDKHRKLYLETSYYQVNDGIGSLVRRFGPERLVFGTGMPLYQPDCPINALCQSGICEEDIRKIACLNLENLLEEVNFND